MALPVSASTSAMREADARYRGAGERPHMGHELRAPAVRKHAAATALTLKVIGAACPCIPFRRV